MKLSITFLLSEVCRGWGPASRLGFSIHWTQSLSFTVEVLTWRGLITYYILFFIEIGSRRVSLGGITRLSVKPEPDPRRRTIDPTTVVISGDRSRRVAW